MNLYAEKFLTPSFHSPTNGRRVKKLSKAFAAFRFGEKAPNAFQSFIWSIWTFLPNFKFAILIYLNFFKNELPLQKKWMLPLIHPCNCIGVGVKGQLWRAFKSYYSFLVWSKSSKLFSTLRPVHMHLPAKKVWKRTFGSAKNAAGVRWNNQTKKEKKSQLSWQIGRIAENNHDHSALAQ